MLTPSSDAFQEVRVAAFPNVADNFVDGFLALHTEALANISTLICVSATSTPPVVRMSSAGPC